MTFDQITGSAGSTSTVQATNMASTLSSVGSTKNQTLAHAYTFSYLALTGTDDTVTLNVSGNTTTTGTVTITDATQLLQPLTGAEIVNIVTSGGSATVIPNV